MPSHNEDTVFTVSGKRNSCLIYFPPMCKHIFDPTHKLFSPIYDMTIKKFNILFSRGLSLRHKGSGNWLFFPNHFLSLTCTVYIIVKNHFLSYQVSATSSPHEVWQWRNFIVLLIAYSPEVSLRHTNFLLKGSGDFFFLATNAFSPWLVHIIVVWHTNRFRLHILFSCAMHMRETCRHPDLKGEGLQVVWVIVKLNWAL